ncbi:MAG: class I SAM-dependent methyltransferase [Desulfobacterales bacterium]|nr:class I SAM-dependent methyltransferase [Desulfobacterales bacterium]
MHEISWEIGNVFRIQPDTSYDLIWCAGLFDYLNDRLASGLLKRIWRWLDVGGEAVIGNFHPSNPTRVMMQWVADWVLMYRTENAMKTLVAKAAIPEESVFLSYEPLGISPFFHMRK